MSGQRTPAGAPAPKKYRADHPIPMTAIDSSRLAEAGHDPSTNTLAVRFPPRKGEDPGTGPVYHYPAFTKDDMGAFLAAESQGVWFGHNVLSNAEKHPATRMWETPKE